MTDFAIKVMDEKELFDYLAYNEKAEFEEKKCNQLEWTLKSNISSDFEGFEIETIISKEYKEYLPKRQLKKEFKEYEILMKHSKMLSFYEDAHYFSIACSGKKYVLTANTSSESFEGFKELLKKNNELLEKLTKAYCEKKKIQIPEFEYLLNTSKIQNENPYFKLIETEIEPKHFETSFEDIGGNLEAKIEMKRIYQDIIHPEVSIIFARDPNKTKGYLLYGEKGNGKTMLVKALATMLNKELKNKVKLYQINYGNLASTLRGGEAEKVRDVFELVKINEKKGLTTLLFLDELQSIGIRRREFNEVLDELLANLDGLESFKKLVFIGATYCPLEELDPALLRPGRLGYHIEVKIPTIEERKEILKIYYEKKKLFVKEKAGFEKLFNNIDLDVLSRETEGFNGSEIMMLFESVLKKKEQETLKNFSNNEKVEDIKASIVPITTNDFLETIKKGQNNKDLNIYT